MLRAVIMGVAGCGKSSVGAALGRRIGARYLDGDDLHPAANIAKMSAGTPLTDTDRWPWLDLVGRALSDSSTPTLIGCSALKRAYRDRIRAACDQPLRFIHLSGSRNLIASRMGQRDGHFMPLSLLDSQFAALEPLQAGEDGFAVDITGDIDSTADACAAHLKA